MNGITEIIASRSGGMLMAKRGKGRKSRSCASEDIREREEPLHGVRGLFSFSMSASDALFYFLEILPFLRMPTSPSKPEPSSQAVAGMGTGVGSLIQVESSGSGKVTGMP